MNSVAFNALLKQKTSTRDTLATKSGECGRCKMPCESCAVQFSVFRRKRGCSECERWYCAACLRRGGGMCPPCRALSSRPLARHAIAHLKVRDLQCFLQRQNVSTRGCVEKEELVSLCIAHVNSVAYRRRGAGGGAAAAGAAGGARSTAGPFTALKGLTTNINEFINSAFDIRPPNVVPARAPPPAPSNVQPTNHSTGNCYNSAHSHTSSEDAGSYPSCKRERFTTRPGGEADVEVEVQVPAARASRSASTLSAPLDTADCFEIEDLDDAGWEFVTSPAEPLPNDSEVLMTENCPEPPRAAPAPAPASLSPGDAGTLREGGTPRRAASELELSRAESAHAQMASDSSSLQDEPLMDQPQETRDKPADTDKVGAAAAADAPVSLEALRSERELEALSVRQLKQLLWRNRVQWAGCVERAELLQRARLLWRDHARAAAEDIEKLPIEECCKICMAAPLQCVLLECGHVVACAACARQLAECPVCRQYVVRAVRLFRS